MHGAAACVTVNVAPATVSVPVRDVSARFPRLYFGLGLVLVVDSKRYRLWFVPLRSAAGEATGRPGAERTIVAGNAFLLSDVGPARSATHKWRTVLT